ncbi:hypothetical protein BGW38_009336, partial [Lunasporangiospora selenospora]
TFVKNVHLHEFSGLPKENVTNWLRDIEEYSNALGLDANQRFQGTRLLLQGNARNWVRNLTFPEDN